MRDLAILRKRSGITEPATVLGAATRADIPDEASACVLDVPHANEDARNLFGIRMPIAIDALAWLPREAALPGPWSKIYAERFRLRLQPHVAWRPPADESGDPGDVVKQVSFLHASSGTSEDAFREHYRHHVALARRHMPALWQYVQNDVEAVEGDAPEAVGVVAVSELWFRTTDDFLNRYFPSEKDQREFSAQEGFLDLTKATSFVCTSHREAPDSGPKRA